MATYCYRREDNQQVVELTMSWDEKRRREDAGGGIVLPDGVRAVRDIAAEHRGFRPTPGNWPQYSDAAGCHESQRQESYEASKRLGVPTQFDHHGRAVFTSPGHRKAYLKAVGLFDRNAGYSDPTPD